MRKRLQLKKVRKNVRLRSSGTDSVEKCKSLSKKLAEYEQKISDLESKLTQALNQPESSEYKELFDDAPVACLVMDEMGLVHKTNHQLRRMLALTTQLSGPFLQFIAKEKVMDFFAHLYQAKTSSMTVRSDILLRSAKGVQIPVEIISRSVEVVNGVRNIHSVVINIDEKTAVKQALERSEHYFHTLTKLFHGIAWDADAETLNLSYISGSAEKILGHPLKLWYTPSFWLNHVHANDREQLSVALAKSLSKAQRLLEQKKMEHGPAAYPEPLGSIQLEFRMLNSNREVVWMLGTIAFYSADSKVRIFVVGMDITERKIAEQGLQRAHAELERRIEDRTQELRDTVSQLETFSYSLSHDMRAPLRSIHGFCEMLQQELHAGLTPLQRDLFHRVMTSTNRLDRLIQDVLHYSQVARTAVELRPIDLEKLVDTTIRDYPFLTAQQANIQISKPLLPVVGHEAFLSQCFSNLFSNALKFVAPGQKPRVSVSTEQVKDQVRVWIVDNGIGIQPEDQRRVFSIFQRFHKAPNLYEGTGIGLAIVAKAVERMGGSLGVESSPGIGSRFWFQLPAG